VKVLGLGEIPTVVTDVGSLPVGALFRMKNGSTTLYIKIGASDGGDRNREPPPRRGTESIDFGTALNLDTDELEVIPRYHQAIPHRGYVVNEGPMPRSEQE